MTQHVEVADATLAFEDEGRGLPVLFLHGFPHDRSLWTHQRRALSSRHRCIVPDLRGFGESTGVAHDLDRHADDMVALLDRLAIDDAVVCGLSMGGYIAMAMWRRHPTRLRAIALCDTKATADTADAREARNVNIAKTRSEGVAAVAASMMEKMVGEETRRRHPGIVETVRAMMERQSPAAVIGALQALRDRPDSRETLKSISVPTLVLVGEEDMLTPMSDAEAMMALLPSAASPRLETIAGAGHVSPIERPAAVTHVIADFLDSL